LAKLEAGRAKTGGIAAGLDDLPLFAASIEAKEDLNPDPLWEALNGIDADTLTPARGARCNIQAQGAGGTGEGHYIAIMTDFFSALPNRRAIIDRRALADHLEQVVKDADTHNSAVLRGKIVGILAGALASGRAEAMRRLHDHPTNGRETVQALAFLTDQILRILYDATIRHLYNPRQPQHE
jgi:hypothetical protein